MRKRRAVGIIAPLSAMLAIAAGCDQPGPGATGVIMLGPDVDASGFETLAVRVFPNPAAGFDPSRPIPTLTLALDRPVAGVSFPYPYALGAKTGETDVESWQLVAWLSRRTGDDVRDIDPGDVYCALPFQVEDCGRSSSACELTHGLDCYLATVAP
jgi:hypothetical protein